MTLVDAKKSSISSVFGYTRKSNENIVLLDSGATFGLDINTNLKLTLDDIMADDWYGLTAPVYKPIYKCNIPDDSKYLVVNRNTIVVNTSEMADLPTQNNDIETLVFSDNYKNTHKSLPSLHDTLCLFQNLSYIGTSGLQGTPTPIDPDYTIGAFEFLNSLRHIDTSGLDNIQIGEKMFLGCTSLLSIDTSHFHNMMNTTEMFSNCMELERINTAPFNNVKLANDMFLTCIALKSIDLSPFTNAIETNRMMKGCYNLKSITMPRNLHLGDDMFYGCSNLKSIEYKGTKKEWMELAKTFQDTNNDELTYVDVKCIDGNISKDTMEKTIDLKDLYIRSWLYAKDMVKLKKNRGEI